MPQKNNKTKILTILYKNLQKAQPQLVPSTTIATKLNLPLTELQNVLKSLKGMGVIETDPDLNFSLITREGLNWLAQQNHGVKTFLAGETSARSSGSMHT